MLIPTLQIRPHSKRRGLQCYRNCTKTSFARRKLEIIYFLVTLISGFCFKHRENLLQGMGGNYPKTEKFATWVTASAGCAAALNQSVVKLTTCTILWAPFSSRGLVQLTGCVHWSWPSSHQVRANTPTATTYSSAQCICCPEVPGRGCTSSSRENLQKK